jgi:hypothetical protein
MTTEQPPEQPPGAPRPPALRVSHADRDQVVELLREAAADGRLTADELDQRVEAALGARTGADLAVLTTDLPAAPARPAPQAKDLIRIDQRFGDAKRGGRWTVPRRMEIKSTAGSVKLDFTEAVITAGTLDIELDLGLGADLTLVTRPGIVVLSDDLAVRMGDVKDRSPQPEAGAPPPELTIELSGRVRGGDIVVRRPRRTPGQWLRREPRP